MTTQLMSCAGNGADMLALHHLLEPLHLPCTVSLTLPPPAAGVIKHSLNTTHHIPQRTQHAICTTSRGALATHQTLT